MSNFVLFQALFLNQHQALELTCWICTGEASSVTSLSKWQSRSFPATGSVIVHAIVCFIMSQNILGRWAIIQSFHDDWLFRAVGVFREGYKVVVAVGIHGNRPGNETLFCARSQSAKLCRDLQSKPNGSKMPVFFWIETIFSRVTRNC